MAEGPKTGRDRLADRYDAVIDREAGRLADRPRRTVVRYVTLLVGGIVALCVVISLAGFALGWFGAAKSIVSPTNVKAQYGAVIDDYEALRAAAGNACAAASGQAQAGDPQLVESPAFAYAAQYRRIAIDYNRRQANIFEAKLVGPKGYPRVAPSLSRMQAEVC